MPGLAGFQTRLSRFQEPGLATWRCRPGRLQKPDLADFRDAAPLSSLIDEEYG
jgi:hypothetical protein